MRFLIKPHQGKEQPYRDALLAAGHVEAKDADVVLIDFEVPYPQLEVYAGYASYTKHIGAALVAFPHGFALVGEHQLTQEPYECAAAFVHGPGQKKIRELYDYPNPVHWCGYPGERKPLEPRECNHVLFAPHHPLGSGWMPDDARRANTEAFRTLLDGNFMLTVRLIGSLEQNGIWEEPGVRYIFGQMDGSVDEADVAVAGGTYAANCLAKGIPVVMFNQEREWRVELQGQRPKMVPGWQEHEDLTRYPYDLSEPDVCVAAAENPLRIQVDDSLAPGATVALVEQWMDRFMPPFNGEKFARIVEGVARLGSVVHGSVGQGLA